MSICISEFSIALIDDQPDSLDLLRYAIKSRLPRTRISAPKSGEIFLQNFSQERPDAVVTRQKLIGNLNGLSLIRTLRQRGFLGPIIMITNSPELEAEAFVVGASDFLTFDRWSELPRRLETLLSGSVGGRSEAQ